MWLWKWRGSFSEQGEEVALLALLNCSPPNSDYETDFLDARVVCPLWQKFGLLGRLFPPLDPAQRREFFRWKKEVFKQRLARNVQARFAASRLRVDAGNLVDLSSFPADQRKLWRTHIGALLEYHPQTLRRPRAFVPQPGASDALFV